QRAHVLAGLDAGLPPAETSGHQAHQLIEMAADGPDLYHGSGSRPRFFLRHNSKIIGRLSCVTNRPLPAQITISDCRTKSPIWAARLRSEREARGWSKHEMARRLLRADGLERGNVTHLARQI